MSDLENLEKELKWNHYKKNLMSIIKDTFGLGMGEMSKTISKMFSAPAEGENQITKELELFEESLINQKKS